MVPWSWPLPAPRPLSAPSPPRSSYARSLKQFGTYIQPQEESGSSIGTAAFLGLLFGLCFILVVAMWWLILCCRAARRSINGASSGAQAAGGAGRTVTTQKDTSNTGTTPTPAPTLSRSDHLRLQVSINQLLAPAARKLDAAAIPWQPLPICTLKYRRQKSSGSHPAGDVQGLPGVAIARDASGPSAAAARIPKCNSKGGCGECPVCLGELQEGDMVRKLPYCLHLFHANCINQWLLKQPSCPICRVRVTVQGGRELGTPRPCAS